MQRVFLINKLKHFFIFLLLLVECQSANSGMLPCNVNQGLTLVSSPINTNYIVSVILKICDKKMPNDPKVLLLHGLYERKISKSNIDYQDAINWLEKASVYADKDNPAPLFELGLTYEWAGKLEEAKAAYAKLLIFDPEYLRALLGMARVNKAENNSADAVIYYQKVLMIDPRNTEALNGLGIINLDNNQLDVAKNYFTKVLSIKKFDSDAKRGLQEINLITGKVIPSSKICQAEFAMRILALPKPPMDVINEIVKVCDKKDPKNPAVLMLHGLIERNIATKTKNYQNAIGWFTKLIQNKPTNIIDPQLELAVTYEWAGKLKEANEIYSNLLKNDPKLRPALLGYARLAVLKKSYDEANKIYFDLLIINPQDLGALNGLGWLELRRKNYKIAREQFYKVLALDNQNLDAINGIKFIKKSEDDDKYQTARKKIILCNANKGLQLLNTPRPPYKRIYSILAKCDRNSPNDVQALLLHGLIARKNKDYPAAISWFKKASALADANNLSPSLELAITYEWIQKPMEAAIIYQGILEKHPSNRASLLGMARIYRTFFDFQKAQAIYAKLLSANPHDVDALNGMAMIELANYRVKQANATFNQVLSIEKGNSDALSGLELAKTVTPYLVSVYGGNYSVQGESSHTTNINLYSYINASDQILLFLTHNSSEIQLSSVIEPTVLPKNSLYLGFQRQFPNQYGWGIYTEYRERTQLRNEYRLGVNANYYILDNIQWFGGIRQGFPSPWNNKLFFNGFNFLTQLPVDFSISGYWGREQFGGSTSSYGIDFRKEFPNRVYYDIGTSYSLSQTSWEAHGDLIVPISKYQRIEGSYQRLYFNGAVIYALGWLVNF